jgi:hypothetical protein
MADVLEQAEDSHHGCQMDGWRALVGVNESGRVQQDLEQIIESTILSLAAGMVMDPATCCAV